MFVGILRMWVSLLVLVGVAGRGTVQGKFPGEEKYELGSLEGDVQNWAVLIENYILQVRQCGSVVLIVFYDFCCF